MREVTFVLYAAQSFWILCLGLVERNQPELGSVCRHYLVSRLGTGYIPSGVSAGCHRQGKETRLGAQGAKAQRDRLQVGVRERFLPGRLTSKEGAPHSGSCVSCEWTASHGRWCKWSLALGGARL